MAAVKPQTAASKAGMARRAASHSRQDVQIEWFINEVVAKINMTMTQRVSIATHMVASRVVKNISTAVGRSGTGKVVQRSKPGEYPRAETTQLMKTIFTDFGKEGDSPVGFVGTPLDYGLILETRMNRSFLIRTLRESYGDVSRILTGPIK